MTTLSPILESVLHEFPGIAYRCLNDACWTVQYISFGVTALTGYTPDVFTGHLPLTYSDLIFADDRERVQQEIGHALDAETSFALTYRIVTAHGGIKFVSEHGNAIRDDDGRIVALQGFVTDVTGARQMQQALDDVAQRFKWIVQATNDNTWDWNLQTNEIWHGDNVRGIFDCPSATTSRKSDCWSTRIHPEDRERVLAGMKAAIGGPGGDWSAEYRFQRKDDSYAEVLNRAVIIRDPEGAAMRMVGGISDLTERTQSRLHLERLDRALRILNQCSQRLVRAEDEHGLLSDLCQLVVEVGGYQAASVSVVNDARWPLQYGASHGAGFQRLIYPDIPLRAEDSGSDGPTAVAMNSREQVVCSDIAHAPLAAGLREELLGRGYRSGIWLPITHGGRESGS